MTALAVVFLAAAAAPALAAPGDGDRAQRMEHRDRPQRDGGARDFNRGARPDGGDFNRGDRGGRGDGSGDRGPRVREAPQAPQAPQAVQAPAPRGERFQGGGEQRSWNRDGDGRRGGADRKNDGRNNDARSNDGRRDWNGRGGDGQRGDRDRNNDGRRDWDRNNEGRRDWNGRGDGRRDGDRNNDGRRDWNGRRDGDHRRWEHGRYPHSYSSSHRYRYRYAWRPPVGFYVHAWNYGDFLPRGWFGPGYWLIDPWEYDLPLPPPGFDWVRVGDDALLVDQFTGRIVQVVRDVFW